MEKEKIVLTGVRLPEREVLVIDGVEHEVKAELVGQRGFWPFRTFAYRLDLSDVIKGYTGTFLRNGKFPTVTDVEGRPLMNYQ